MFLIIYAKNVNLIVKFVRHHLYAILVLIFLLKTLMAIAYVNLVHTFIIIFVREVVL